MGNIDVLTVGDCTLDNIFEVDKDEASVLCNLKSQEKELCFNFGEKIPIKSVSKGFGGSALNTAIGFSRLNLNTAIATIIGEDFEGHLLKEFLKNEKIDISFIKFKDTTNVSLILVYDKERTVLSYHRPRNYTALQLPSCSNIYFSSAGKGAEVIYPKVISRVTAGSKLYFNPGSWELQNFNSFAPLVRHCQALIINKDEADLIIGGDKVQDQLKKMKKLGTAIAVITCGKSGAYLQDDTGQYHMGISSGPVVDPTGAGDSFSAGFVSGLIMGKSLEESCRWGMVNSAAVISKVGANNGLLHRSDLESQTSSMTILKFSKLQGA